MKKENEKQRDYCDRIKDINEDAVTLHFLDMWKRRASMEREYITFHFKTKEAMKKAVQGFRDGNHFYVREVKVFEQFIRCEKIKHGELGFITVYYRAGVEPIE